MEAASSLATSPSTPSLPSGSRSTNLPSGARELTDLEERILGFERQWWKFGGAKEQAIRDLFDLNSTRYYQMLNALLDEPAALAADPMLVKRLRRLRDTRQRARQERRLGSR